MDGRIFQLDVHNVDGVIMPSDLLMLLVPDGSALMVEARIATRDVDQISQGQNVDLRFSAFDQRTTPEIGGEVVFIAPDAVADQRTGSTYYPVRIKPKQESLATANDLSLHPGMPVEVFVRIADRSVISYLTKPLADQMRHDFRED